MKRIATAVFSIATAALSLLGVLGLSDLAALMGGRYGALALLAATGGLAWLGRTSFPQEEMVAVTRFRYGWALALAAALALTMTAASFGSIDLPHGDWDAWSIWNLRAKFLADPDSWRNAVSPLAIHSHPDYPLLTSAVAADFMKFNVSPASLAAIFFAAVPAVLVSTLWLLRGAAPACLAALAFAASAGYITQGPSQYADIPLSAFLLCSLASLWQPKHPYMLFGAGLFAGFAAFTKNEGIVFAVALLLAAGLMWRAALLPLLCGALPGLLITAWFKLLFAPPSEYAGQSLAKLFEPGRWMAILGEFFKESWNLGVGVGHPVLILAVLAFGLRFAQPLHRIWKLAAVVIGCQLAGYIAAYLLTPADLNWQLSTSMNRLLAQVWPSTLLLFFLALRAPSDPAGRA
jgi:hypothetical protein